MSELAQAVQEADAMESALAVKRFVRHPQTDNLLEMGKTVTEWVPAAKLAAAKKECAALRAELAARKACAADLNAELRER